MFVSHPSLVANFREFRGFCDHFKNLWDTVTINEQFRGKQCGEIRFYGQGLEYNSHYMWDYIYNNRIWTRVAGEGNGSVFSSFFWLLARLLLAWHLKFIFCLWNIVEFFWNKSTTTIDESIFKWYYIYIYIYILMRGQGLGDHLVM